MTVNSLQEAVPEVRRGEHHALDLPQDSAGLQWWYFHAHLYVDEREYSLFASFFIAVTGRDESSGAPLKSHALTWSLTDVAAVDHRQDSRVDPSATEIGLRSLKTSSKSGPRWIDRAMTEVLNQGVVPLPDRTFSRPVNVGSESLDLDFGGCSLTRVGDGGYLLKLDDARGGSACDLVFHPCKEAVLQGRDGLIRGLGSEEMYYYSITRCEVRGKVRVGGAETSIHSGQGWYDREFDRSVLEGRPSLSRPDHEEIAQEFAWTWLAVQLEDGTDICAYEAVDRATGELVEKQLLVVAGNGTAHKSTDFDLSHMDMWCSPRTFQEYPTTYRLRAEEFGVDLKIEATVRDQEFMTVIARPAFWEGACRVAGTFGGGSVSGRAFVERTGFGVVDDLESLSASVNRVVRSTLDTFVPWAPGRDQMRTLIASDARDHYMDGVDLPTLTRSLIAPLREIADRGGKSWRSYVTLVCCDAVGGDSSAYVPWLAAPELLHVGSMIVDDVQDRSDKRRGGPTAHSLFGQSQAINAGTAAYFLAERILANNRMTREQNLRLYELYFLAMRAGHAGQALDLGGVGDLVPRAVQSGDVSELVKRVMACYRLKTAAPVSCLAAMGAVAGGGTEEQIESLSAYVESVALGFQIMDDVLNLRGFEGDRKSRGEDVRNGVVTLPITYAIGRLPPQVRTWLWETLASRTEDPAEIAEVLAVIEGCGALESCARYAADLVENGWKVVEPTLEPSFYSVMLRAFGWFAVERQH